MTTKGKRVRELFNSEAEQLLSIYKNIEKLIPNEKTSGSAHHGEEGRYIEYLIRDFLNKHLPQQLEAFTGFIHRPATKTGDGDRTRRRKEFDKHSAQIDIIVYDKANYPIFERFEEFVVVPPEGVIGIISIKKALRTSELEKEIKSLINAVSLCRHYDRNGKVVRGPSTTIFTFKNMICPNSSFEKRMRTIYKKIENSHKDITFDQCIGQIIALDSYSLFKRRPNDEESFDKNANYIAFNNSKNEYYHFPLQFLLTSILSSFYHQTRTPIHRPGFTSFPTDKKHDIDLGILKVTRLR
ncbi:DUF6602 domain-containing protein [Christiangramia aquimixticola]|uniref:DUF6602 domain-containing protein n=1 Tax=Christiangramia aquimixticola TaxID=1697558 RepID=UPI003AA7AD36